MTGRDSLCRALHPLTLELRERVPAGRERLCEAWGRLLPKDAQPIPPRIVAEAPVVASGPLLAALTALETRFVEWLKPWRERTVHPSWPHLGAPDVVCLDVVLAHSEEAPGWELRCVEFQAFTSILGTLFTLHHAAADIWPELRGSSFYGPKEQVRHCGDWLRETQAWLAPTRHSVLLENNPWSQATVFDLEATRHWWGTPIVDVKSVHLKGSRLFWDDPLQGSLPVSHALNRAILHEALAPKELHAVLSSCHLTWHSHPAWYYLVNKALLPEFLFTGTEKCALGSNWRVLGLDASELVAKAHESYGGAGVRLHNTAKDLDNLPNPQTWVVQPRFRAAQLFRAPDGAPLFGEVRCILDIRPGQPAWTAGRFMRLYRGDKASSSQMGSTSGSGVAPLLNPPACWSV